MEEIIFNKYKVVETIESCDLTALYIVEEEDTGNKFALRKVLTDTSNPLYKTALKEFKKVEKEKDLKLDKKEDSPAILDFFIDEDSSFLLLEFKDKKSLKAITSYPSIGKILNNRYLVVRGIASGGFGVVYMVRDLSLPGKYWALKEMHEEGGISDVIERSFRMEAEMLSRLEHPRIPRISDFFVEKEKLYLIMDYVEGETLRKKIRNLKAGEFFRESQIIEWALNLCNVLEYMHTRPSPIIFRDLKPDNIMITSEGVLKLVDFGIAKIFQGPRSDTTKYTLLTAGYAAPEQSLGKAEPRSDIYSLGATLYHLITLVHPKKVAPSFPPVEEFNPSVSPLLSKIISKALELKLEERFQTIIEIKEELLKLHKYKEAEQHLVKAKDYEGKDDYFNANFEYMKALELFQGGNYEILTAIARCYENLGFKDKALEHYEKAIKLEVPDKLRDELQKKIKDINSLEPDKISHKDADKFATRKNLQGLQRPSIHLSREKKEERKSRGKGGKFSLLFISIILVIGVLLSVLVYFLIDSGITGREQAKVSFAVKSASAIYDEEMYVIKKELEIISKIKDFNEIDAGELDVDYLYKVDKDEKDSVESEIVKAAFEGEEKGGTRVIEEHELKRMGEKFYKKSEIELKLTEKARPVSEKFLKKAMAIEYAIPLMDEKKRVESVIYGGKIINRDFDLIEKIRDRVFEDKMFNGKPVGTVTIFLDDVRITTNVLDSDGKPAIGTRASQEVYEKVVIEGEPWLGRAFVVNKWYLTNYDPIKDIQGNIIGILYAGYLENYLKEENKIIIYSFWAIIFFATIFAIIFYIYFRQGRAEKGDKTAGRAGKRLSSVSDDSDKDDTGTTASRTEYKFRGIDDYEKKNYPQAIENFTKSRAKNPADGFTSIYIQNSYLALSGNLINTIGMTVPLSGPLGDNGGDLVRGVALAQIELNKVFGRENKGIEIIVKDDCSTMAGAINNANLLCNDDNVLAVIGNMTSDQGKATGPVYNNKSVVIVNPVATYLPFEDPGPWVFKLSGERKTQTDMLSKYCLEKKKFSAIALLYDETQDYSYNMAMLFKDKIIEDGGQIALEQNVALEVTDFSGEIREMIEKNIDVAFFSGLYSDMVKLAVKLKEKGSSLSLVGGGISFHTGELLIKGGDAVDGMVFTSFFDSDFSADTRKFSEKFYNTFKVYPVSISALAYDATLVLGEAILRGGPSSELIRDYFNSMNSPEKAFSGITGKIYFDNFNNSPRSVYLTVVRGGKFTLLNI